MDPSERQQRLDALQLSLALIEGSGRALPLAELERSAELLEWIAEAPDAYVSALSGAPDGPSVWLQLSSKGFFALSRALDSAEQALAGGDPGMARAIDGAGARVLAALTKINAASVTELKAVAS